MIIHTKAHVPAELAAAWLAHLRDFDNAHPGCHFEVVTEGTMTIDDLIAQMDPKPDMRFMSNLAKLRDAADDTGFDMTRINEVLDNERKT